MTATEKEINSVVETLLTNFVSTLGDYLVEEIYTRGNGTENFTDDEKEKVENKAHEIMGNIWQGGKTW